MSRPTLYLVRPTRIPWWKRASRVLSLSYAVVLAALTILCVVNVMLLLAWACLDR